MTDDRYQFGMWPDRFQSKEIEMVAAIGNGDQRIYWNRGNDVIVVITAGNYNQWDIKEDSYALLTNYIYPANM